MAAILSVAIGGALGAVMRYLVTGWVHRAVPPGFPYGTLTVNVAGSLAVGFLVGIFATRAGSRDQLMYLFLIVGVCGGFTTFSAFSADTYQMVQRGAVAVAAVNAALQVIGSLAAVFAGFWLARQV